MSDFNWECRVCGSKEYRVRYGPGNGCIGPGYYAPIIGLSCEECHIVYDTIPPDPSVEAERREAEARQSELTKAINQMIKDGVIK